MLIAAVISKNEVEVPSSASFCQMEQTYYRRGTTNIRHLKQTCGFLLTLTVVVYDFTLLNHNAFIAKIQLLTRVQVDNVKLLYAHELFLYITCVDL